MLFLNGQPIESLPWKLIGEGNYFTGSRVLTTILIKNLRPVDFHQHWIRLEHDCEQIGLVGVPKEVELRSEIDYACSLMKSRQMLRVRVILFKNSHGKIEKLVAVDVLENFSQDHPDLKLSVAYDYERLPSAHIKSGHLGHTRSIALEKEKAKGFEDILWVNANHEITEATWSNIFLIGRTGDLVEIATPDEKAGLLPGITRRRMIHLLESAGIPVTIRPISLEELPRFDEGFLTSSIGGLRPIAQVGRHRLHTGRPNATFHHIKRLYNTWLALDHDAENEASSFVQGKLDRFSH